MTLNVEKYEVTHFSKWTKEATWPPTVKLLSQNLSYAEFPTFLGVTFDRQLTFRQHVGRIKQKAAKRINTLRCLAGKSWGSEKEDLRLVYLTYIRSAISYAYNAWYPWVSKENREKLEVTQRDAARTITGCTKNTNSKLLINEAGLVPLYIESDIAQATAYERCLRLPCDDPLREIAENPVRRRLKSLGTWRETGKSSAEDSVEDLPRECLIPVPDIPPWMIPDTFSCSPSLMTSVSKTDPPEAQKAAVEETMKYLAKPDIEIYIDGSAMDGTDYVGGGISIRYPNGEKESMSIAAGRHGSSFRAEAMALTTALRWLDERKKCRNLLILTDSQALVRKLEGGAEKSISELENETWRLIYRVARRDNTRLHIHWIPGHCGVHGNDEADLLANQGQMLDQFDTAIDFASAKNVFRKPVLKTVWAHQNVRESQPTGIRPLPRRDKESGLTRRERVVLAQLRCNEKSPILQQYLYSSGAADSEACLTCGASPDNLDHVLKDYPTGAPYRDSLPENPRDALWTDPVRVVEFLRTCNRVPVALIV
ncbi:ribonuclease H [Elysia marginata]|uniref:Ribonuclease H n=1 Tax=Elysia marginata TaxID=1093978 RepID=A0AAV4IIW0_9GAST|nr:ribonuclease H [Elysia marginata]